MEVTLSSCTDLSLGCVSDTSAIEAFLKNKVLATVFNQDSFNVDEYDEQDVIEKKAVI